MVRINNNLSYFCMQNQKRKKSNIFIKQKRKNSEKLGAFCIFRERKKKLDTGKGLRKKKKKMEDRNAVAFYSEKLNKYDLRIFVHSFLFCATELGGNYCYN